MKWQKNKTKQTLLTTGFKKTKKKNPLRFPAAKGNKLCQHLAKLEDGIMLAAIHGGFACRCTWREASRHFERFLMTK